MFLFYFYTTSTLYFKLDKMTKGLTGLASHNSNMVAPHEQNYEGGWTIYRTKRSCRAERLAKRNTQSFFEDDLESQPPMKIKTKASDDESICSEITQHPFFLKSPPRIITQSTVHQE